MGAFMNLILWSIIILGVLFSAAILFYFLIFKRDPKRTIPGGNTIVSPTDGKIVQIVKTKNPQVTIPKGLMGKIKTLCKDVSSSCIIISIMMTPLDVHYQRAPIGGKVISTKYNRGTFKNLSLIHI